MKKITLNNVSKEFEFGNRSIISVLFRLSSFISGRRMIKKIKALDSVSFEVDSGEIVGIIGDNGSGKSTLLRVISEIYPVYTGRVDYHGKIVSLIGLGNGAINRLTMRENIFLVGSLFGLSKHEIKKKFDSIVEFSGLKDFVDTNLYKFSSGMLQRLSFSIAVHSNPDILLLDEVFEVGDEDFRKKSSDMIRGLVRKGVSVVFVSHDLDMIKKYCDRVVWLEKGKVKCIGKPKVIINKYLNHKDS